MPHNTSVGVLLLVTICVPATSAVAQTPSNVLMVRRPARIQRWLHVPSTDVLLEVEPGTTLEVLDKQEDWFWVIVPPDAHGTRRAGWIRAGNVEPVIARSVVTTPEQGQRDEPASLASVSPAASAVPAPTSIAQDKVTVTETRGETASTTAHAPVATKAYQFEDVHFDRNRYSLRGGDMDILRAAMTALKADPSLVVSIEGHTCNLGTTAYNLALGLRRADAVKHYLESEGIAADRLHTVSLGEGHPKYDNSREQTRRLNRRVELAPNVQKP
jgi:outer membrane protein OmpA-like peptidoglycan-associated protein